MTIRDLLTDPLGTRRDTALAKAGRRIARLESRAETLRELNERRISDLIEASVRMDQAAALHADMRRVLIEELATFATDPLAGGWAWRLAATLADRTGVDLQPAIHRRINETTGQHQLPAPPPADKRVKSLQEAFQPRDLPTALADAEQVNAELTRRLADAEHAAALGEHPAGGDER